MQIHSGTIRDSFISVPLNHSLKWFAQIHRFIQEWYKTFFINEPLNNWLKWFVQLCWFIQELNNLFGSSIKTFTHIICANMQIQSGMKQDYIYKWAIESFASTVLFKKSLRKKRHSFISEPLNHSVKWFFANTHIYSILILS